MGGRSISAFASWQLCQALSGGTFPHLPPPRGQRKSVLHGPGPRSALLSSSAVLYREVNMLIVATAALLVLAANAEAAAIQVVRIILYLLYFSPDFSLDKS